MESKLALLRQQVAATETQLRDLKQQLARAEQQTGTAHASESDDPPHASMHKRWPLTAEEYQRYGRSMVMREIGMQGQVQLKNAKVLVVGVGGLGCPAAAYLAGAGVGTLGLVDGDHVEVSNLHRQIAHSTETIGMSKVYSAERYLKALNPLVNYKSHPDQLTPSTAISVFEQYDLVLDCTDHPTSRYLISDACVLTGRPLVSASALRAEGQLIVLNNPPFPPGSAFGGPCYRCIFPKPPPAQSVLSCGEGGILGPVVGVMGVLQALEAIKLLTASSISAKTILQDPTSLPPRSTMLLFSAYSTPQFRTIRMRSRHTSCSACSTTATITRQSLETDSLDYIAFCGLTSPLNILPPDQRISAGDFFQQRVPVHGTEKKILLVDVRDETQFAMCALENSVNIPWTGNSESWLAHARDACVYGGDINDCYVICRFGNDSQLAVKAILEQECTSTRTRDIRGGFKAWREEVDHEWPLY